MINNCVLVGRLTKEIELKKTPNGVSVVQFSLAVPRDYNKETADFINCVAWRNQAEYLANYAKKGNTVSVVGKIQVRSYEKSGKKIYVTEVMADKVALYTTKQSNATNEPQNKPQNVPYQPTLSGGDGFTQADIDSMNSINDINSDDLPFY